MATATLTNRVNGVSVKVHTTTEHSACSYGRAIWVDDENNPYIEFGSENAVPLYEFSDIVYDDLPEIEVSNREDLASAITKLRESRGMTRYALSKLSGLTQTNLTKIENGETSLTIDSLLLLLNALGAKLKVEG